jgi:hypothetical protein
MQQNMVATAILHTVAIFAPAITDPFHNLFTLIGPSGFEIRVSGDRTTNVYKPLNHVISQIINGDSDVT